MKPFSIFTLMQRSLRYRWRGHVGVLLGAAVGSAALIGALIVGDSVRESLRELALQRLGPIHFALDTGDRLFRSRLGWYTTASVAVAEDGSRPAGSSRVFVAQNGATVFRWVVSNSITSLSLSNTGSIPNSLFGPGGFQIIGGTNTILTISPVLKLPATASTQGAGARANQVQLLGVDDYFAILAGTSILSNLAQSDVILNAALAEQLQARPGDTILLRTRKPEDLAADSPVAPTENSSIVLRRRVAAILPPEQLGNFSLTANQVPPLNAFVSLLALQEQTGAHGSANLLLANLPTRVYWQRPTFSWRLWVRQKLSRIMPGSMGTLSLWQTNALAPEVALTALQKGVESRLELVDLQLQFRDIPARNEFELRSPRIFLDPPVVQVATQAMLRAGASTTSAANSARSAPSPKPYGVLTYLVNLIRHGDRATPYSMITAAEAPLVPGDLREDEILINQWLADDLQAAPGSELDLSYFLPDAASQLLERTNRFRVRAILPMSDPALDRTLMPDFPGVAQAEKAGDWQTGFPLVHKIRDQDDAYWKTYRGTPKAFISLAAGQRLWQNRFGNLTAIRMPHPQDAPSIWVQQTTTEQGLKESLGPAGRAVGFRFEPVRERALAASAQAQDFGQLFLGFSFFLILAALILMAMLFQFGLEQRTTEIGLLLAVGLMPKRVRRLMLLEGTMVALAGGIIGVFGGIAYALAMIRGLTTLWRDAVGTSALRFHVTPLTLGIGLFASVAVCALTIWLVLRKQARQPARVLLAPGAEEDLAAATASASKPRRPRSLWVGLGSGLAAFAMLGWALAVNKTASAETFFGAGSLLLVAALAFASVLLWRLEHSQWSKRLSLSAMGLRNCTRRRKRSLATVALLACGSFLVVAVGANRLDAGRDAAKRSSGTGGFALLGESTLPVVRDLNTTAGRDFYGLDNAVVRDVRFVPFRVRAGDDASCLNLNRAQNPRLLGVNPSLLAERGAFAFASVLKGLDANAGWNLLSAPRSAAGAAGASGTNDIPEIPAIGDAASIQWALHLQLGDTLDYTDEHGHKFRVRLVGALANSLLQGNLIIDEAEFVRRFPSEAGHRFFLIDVPATPGALEKVSAALTRALQDAGLELTPCARRLAAFNAVQNTYLNTFQVLGGIGLLLGSAGLAVVVLRNVLERRSELGLLRAIGFRRRSLLWLVLSEHGGLLVLGLGAGMIAALAAILPVLLAPGAELHSRALLATLIGVLASGLFWTWCATWLALRGESLDALREE